MSYPEPTDKPRVHCPHWVDGMSPGALAKMHLDTSDGKRWRVEYLCCFECVTRLPATFEAAVLRECAKDPLWFTRPTGFPGLVS